MPDLRLVKEILHSAWHLAEWKAKDGVQVTLVADAKAGRITIRTEGKSPQVTETTVAKLPCAPADSLLISCPIPRLGSVYFAAPAP